MNRKILIIKTSFEKKTIRIFPGDEWSDSWKFDENEEVAFRKGLKDVEYLNLNSLLDKIDINGDEDVIIWIRGKEKIEKIECIVQLFKNIIDKFAEEEYQIYFAYHEPDIINKEVSQKKMSKYIEYGLSSDTQFKNIIKIDKDGKKYLDIMAPFEDIFNCFFLHPPDVLATVIHKVNGILSTLDLDLQTLLDCDFRDDIWVEITNSYKDSKKLEEVKEWINGDEYSLNKMVEQKKNGNQYIEREYKAISSLIEETDSIKPLEPLENILSGFNSNQRDAVRLNIEGFRNWYKKLLMAFENFIEIVKVKNEK